MKSKRLAIDIDTIKDFLIKLKNILKLMSKETVSVIGLGFVGFPTACILANKENYFKVIGIDKNIKKISTEKI